jgi:hypothetical protein
MNGPSCALRFFSPISLATRFRAIGPERIGRKRVERLMRLSGLSGPITTNWRGTKIRVPSRNPADPPHGAFPLPVDKKLFTQAIDRRWIGV